MPTDEIDFEDFDRERMRPIKPPLRTRSEKRKRERRRNRHNRIRVLRRRRIRSGAPTCRSAGSSPANAIIAQSAWSIVLLAVAYGWSAPTTKAVTNEATRDAASASGGHEYRMVETPQNPREAFDTLTNFVIFGGSIFYAMAVGAVFVLRRKMPNAARPYRTWGYPLTPALYLLAFSGAMASMLHDKWLQTAAGSVLILAGVIAFYAMGGGSNTKELAPRDAD